MQEEKRFLKDALTEAEKRFERTRGTVRGILVGVTLSIATLGGIRCGYLQRATVGDAINHAQTVSATVPAMIDAICSQAVGEHEKKQCEKAKQALQESIKGLNALEATLPQRLLERRIGQAEADKDESTVSNSETN